MGNKGVRFIDQGLDHFLAKPVNEAQLLTVLARLFADRAERRCETPRPTEPGSQSLPILDREKGLSLASGDAMLWRRSVTALRAQVKEIFQELRTAVAGHDHVTAARLAHRITGTAGYVAAEELAHHAGLLQAHAGKRDIPAMSSAQRALERAVDRFVAATQDVSPPR